MTERDRITHSGQQLGTPENPLRLYRGMKDIRASLNLQE